MFSTIKVINAILILVLFFMGIRNGWATFIEKPEALAMFNSLGIPKNIRVICSVITLISSLMLLSPKTFVWGVFLQLSIIILLAVMHLHINNIKGFLIELPFIALAFLVVYFKHPLAD